MKGAGVFGALTHIKATKAKKFKKNNAEDAFTDPDWTQDDGDAPPKWAVKRKMLKSELENEIPGTPFETYKLTRGKKHSAIGSTLKVTGKLKCLVRVYEMRYEKVEMEVEIPDGKLTT